MLKRIKSVIEIEMKIALPSMISFKDLMAMITREEQKCSIVHLSSDEENTDKGNKLQLQHKVKRCKKTMLERKPLKIAIKY